MFVSSFLARWILFKIRAPNYCSCIPAQITQPPRRMSRHVVKHCFKQGIRRHFLLSTHLRKERQKQRHRQRRHSSNAAPPRSMSPGRWLCKLRTTREVSSPDGPLLEFGLSPASEKKRRSPELEKKHLEYELRSISRDPGYARFRYAFLSIYQLKKKTSTSSF